MSDATSMITTPIKPLLLHTKEDLGKKINKQLTYAWYFEKPYEKIIMVVLNVLGLWKLTELVWGLF